MATMVFTAGASDVFVTVTRAVSRRPMYWSAGPSIRRFRAGSRISTVWTSVSAVTPPARASAERSSVRPSACSVSCSGTRSSLLSPALSGSMRACTACSPAAVCRPVGRLWVSTTGSVSPVPVFVTLYRMNTSSQAYTPGTRHSASMSRSAYSVQTSLRSGLVTSYTVHRAGS